MSALIIILSVVLLGFFFAVAFWLFYTNKNNLCSAARGTAGTLGAATITSNSSESTPLNIKAYTPYAGSSGAAPPTTTPSSTSNKEQQQQQEEDETHFVTVTEDDNEEDVEVEVVSTEPFGDGQPTRTTDCSVERQVLQEDHHDHRDRMQPSSADDSGWENSMHPAAQQLSDTSSNANDNNDNEEEKEMDVPGNNQHAPCNGDADDAGTQPHSPTPPPPPPPPPLSCFVVHKPHLKVAILKRHTSFPSQKVQDAVVELFYRAFFAPALPSSEKDANERNWKMDVANLCSPHTGHCDPNALQTHVRGQMRLIKAAVSVTASNDKEEETNENSSESMSTFSALKCEVSVFDFTMVSFSPTNKQNMPTNSSRVGGRRNKNKKVNGKESESPPPPTIWNRVEEFDPDVVIVFACVPSGGRYDPNRNDEHPPDISDRTKREEQDAVASWSLDDTTAAVFSISPDDNSRHNIADGKGHSSNHDLIAAQQQGCPNPVPYLLLHGVSHPQDALSADTIHEMGYAGYQSFSNNRNLVLNGSTFEKAILSRCVW